MSDDFDVIVIGMGVAGEEVSGRVAEAGLDVLGIDKKLVGGECPYWGCIPSKIMVRAGDSLAEAARVVGLAGEAQVSPDWAPVVRRVREATANWDDQIAVERLENKGGTFVRGAARFVDRNAVEVDGRRFTARRGIVIATGGAPAIPPIPGLTDGPFWTNREAIETEVVPSSLVVLGAGAVGLELAQTFARFGSRVTVVEMAPTALPLEEPENGTAMGEALQAEGITLFTGVSATGVKYLDKEVSVELSDGSTVGGERLLVATGRVTDLKSLGADVAGLDVSARFIDTDEHMRVAPGLWAAGDVVGGGFTHTGVYQGRIVAADILGQDHRPADLRIVPRVTFTDPEVAGVGLREDQARDQGTDVRIGVAPTASSARGWIHGPGAEHGVVKLVADANENVLVGGSVMGPRAGDVIGFIALAAKEKIPIANLKDLIYPYPTFVRGVEDALSQIG